jgi:predicted DNA-binding transcriptional regulator AlpA
MNDDVLKSAARKSTPSVSIVKIGSELQITAMDHLGQNSTSKRVNEAYPPCNEILSAHDVARLTRRSWWNRFALTCFGRFPRKKRCHGRAVGWLRCEVLDWMTRDLQIRSVADTTSHLRVAEGSGLPRRLPLDGSLRHARQHRRNHRTRRGAKRQPVSTSSANSPIASSDTHEIRL